MTKPMTAKEALELAIECIEKVVGAWDGVTREGKSDSICKLEQAAHILRNGTQPVEVVDEASIRVCLQCGSVENTTYPKIAHAHL